MELYTKKITNEAIKYQDETKIASSWVNFQAYLKKVDAIKKFKEEKYQQGFLRDVFEACLVYKLDNTNPNLSTFL